MKLSIIIPVYDVEKYLKTCLDSIIIQSNEDIEIILVDDGSKDDSPSICDEYSSKYKNVNAIHKINGGLSDARNTGISIATGDYLMFVDSDDYLESNSIETIQYYLSKYIPDILVGDARVINGKHDLKHSGFSLNLIVTGPQYLLAELESGGMSMAAWLNIYRRDFLIENDLKFKVGILHEDEEFTPRVFLMAKKVVYSECMFYQYVIRDNSITTNRSQVKNAIDFFNICYELEKIYTTIDDESLKVVLRDSLSYKYLDRFQRSQFYKKEYKHYVDKQFVMRNAYSMKTKVKATLFNLNLWLYYIINKSFKYFLS